MSQPSNNAWTNCDLPKSWVVNNSTGTANCVTCITSPRTVQPGKFCCKVEGCKIILETYRRQHDVEPIMTKEELYPTGEVTDTMFQAFRMVLGKGKQSGFGIFAF